MAGKPADPDPGYVLRCAALDYADALAETGGKRGHPFAAKAWDRLRRAAERYRDEPHTAGRPVMRCLECATPWDGVLCPLCGATP